MYNFNLENWHVANATAAGIKLAVYICPSNKNVEPTAAADVRTHKDRPYPGKTSFAAGHYGANWGGVREASGAEAFRAYPGSHLGLVLTVVDPDAKVKTRNIKFADVTDGLSFTLAMVEKRSSFGWAVGGWGGTEFDVNLVPNYEGDDAKLRRAFSGSYHPGGVNVLWGDGSVKFLKSEIDAKTWRALTTRAGARSSGSTDPARGGRSPTAGSNGRESLSWGTRSTPAEDQGRRRPGPSIGPRDGAMSKRFRSLLVRYLLALIAVVLATAANLALVSSMGPGSRVSSLPIFLAAVMVAAWSGGLGPGLAAGVLAAAVINPLFSSRQRPDATWTEATVRVALFLGTAAFISSLVESKRRAEQAERRRRVWYEAMLTSVGDGVIATDATGLVSFLNAAAEAITGWSHARAIGRPIDDVFPSRTAGAACRSRGRRRWRSGSRRSRSRAPRRSGRPLGPPSPDRGPRRHDPGR